MAVVCKRRMMQTAAVVTCFANVPCCQEYLADKVSVPQWLAWASRKQLDRSILRRQARQVEHGGPPGQFVSNVLRCKYKLDLHYHLQQTTSDHGVVVSISAFQALESGSIPDGRTQSIPILLPFRHISFCVETSWFVFLSMLECLSRVLLV